MKVLPFKVPISEETSFRVQIDRGKHFYDKFHHHQEVQITWIQKSFGSLLMGNAIATFEENDLLVIGANVPHSFQNNEIFYKKNSKLSAEAISILFNKNAFGKSFFDLPEMKNIKNFIKNADKGYRIKGETKNEIITLLKLIEKKNGPERFLSLMDILNRLSISKEVELLSNLSFLGNPTSNESKKLETVFQYMLDHHQRTIKLEEVAKVANLSVSAFCRFFKLRTRKTFSQFVNEFRISVACKKLLLDDFSISEICYEVGFTNLSNFNRQFKKITGFTPSQYVSKHGV
ncbi:MAG: AraC family transcriptional regulator [Saprospiraceae bacterium]